MSTLHRLFAHYVSYHRHGPLMLRYVSALGFTAVPLFYLLRFTKSEQVYDDWIIRVIVAVLCLGLYARDSWPERLKPLYYPYSYLVLIVGLPTTITFTSLHHGGGTVAVANTMMAAALVMLLADWRNMVVIFLSGMLLGTLLYLATAPFPQMPVGYLPRLPVLLVTLFGGSLIKHALELAAAERVRQTYASLAGSIAHEMRNPLSQLKHTLYNIQQTLPRPTMGTQPQALGATEIDALYGHVAHGDIAVKRGLQVISMTLDEVHAKPMDPNSFVFLSAAQVCQAAVDEYGYENADERARVSLRVEQNFVFKGDETAYLFVLFNLLKNALYYATAHPQARVVITVDRGRVLVRDTGPGIAPAALRKLFEPFHTSGKAGGTGLGLAYCARVVRAFGGTISCDSVLCQFTEFAMSLPMATPEEQETYREAVLMRAQQIFSGQRVLVVDDDVVLRTATLRMLLPMGAKIDEAADGRQALEALSQTRYDMVVLDLNMPHMDGYAVAQAVRGGMAPASRQARIVAYTSEPARLARVKAEKAGFDELVSKPSEQVMLVQTLCLTMGRPSRHAHAQGSLAGRTALLADDSTFNRKVVAACLRQAGITVAEAGCGQDALALLQSMSRCDFILLDIEMPGMGGIEAARAIRASTMACRNAPILALTAHSGADMVAAALDAGMSDLLLKPVEMATLHGKLLALHPPAAAEPCSAPTLVGAAAPPVASLLDVGRLESLRRMGLLKEFLGDYIPAVERLLHSVEAAASASNVPACRDALHSLVGMSGQAGANALYRLARSFYMPLVEEGHWPAQVDWTHALRALADKTQQEMADYLASVPEGA